MSKKISIVTFNNALNYGALLQAYALQMKIKSLGYDCNILNYQQQAFKEWYTDSHYFLRCGNLKRKISFVYDIMIRPVTSYKSKTMMRKLILFEKNYFDLSPLYTRETLHEANKLFDTFVLGSDQVWNTRLYDYDTSFFLDFVAKGKKEITYAASFGKDHISGFEYENLKKTLPNFEAVSIREKTGAKILKDCFNVDSTVVLDPTLLHKMDFWEKISGKSNLKIKKPYIFIYIVAPSTNLIKCVNELASKEELTVISPNHIKGLKHYKNYSQASIEDFLWLIQHAKYVFTTSFHGLAFSINFHKDFFYELDHGLKNNNSRLTDLCALLGLQNREIIDGIPNNFIDWKDVEERLDVQRNISNDYLESALKND